MRTGTPYSARGTLIGSAVPIDLPAAAEGIAARHAAAPACETEAALAVPAL